MENDWLSVDAIICCVILFLPLNKKNCLIGSYYLTYPNKSGYPAAY